MHQIYIMIRVILFLFLSISLFGQGSYLPSDADLSFPRSIMDQSEIELLKDRLVETNRIDLYQAILNSAFQEVPPNILDSDRRKRALIAREAAFVLLMNLKVESNQLVPLTQEDQSLLMDHCIEILNSINDGILVLNGWTFYNDWQLRTKELVHFLIAYDLLKANDNLNVDLTQASRNLQQYVGKLFTLVKDTYPSPLGTTRLEFFSFNLNNHGVMVSSTLGLAAIVLAELESAEEDLQPQAWMNAAMWNLDNTLWKADGILKRTSEPGRIAGYAEGPNYFDYGFENAFPFLRAMWNFLPDSERTYTFYEYNLITGQRTTITREIQNPWYDKNYERLFDWAVNIRMPDGRSPAIHDSYLGFGSNMIALSGNSKHNIPARKLSLNNPWIRTQYLATNTSEGMYNDPLFLSYPDAGSLIFRNTFNDPTGMYLHVIAKNGVALEGAKAHHQADAGSFQLYFNETDLVYEGGFPGADQRGIVNTASDHNIILVDGKGPQPPNGEFIDIQNETFIRRGLDFPSFDVGHVQTSYENAEIDRKFFYLHDRYFLVIDDLKSNENKSYTFQLHGHGLDGKEADDPEGTYDFDIAENLITYQKGNNKLLAKSIANVASNQRFRNDSVAIQFHAYQDLSVHELTTEPAQEAQIMTILKPGVDLEVGLEAKKLNTPFGFVIEDELQTFCFTQKENESLNISEGEINLKSNGALNVIGMQEGALKFAYVENGDSILLNNTLRFSINKKMDLAIEQTGSYNYHGYIDGACTLRIQSDSSLFSEDTIINSIKYNPNTNISIIEFGKAGSFNLSKGSSEIVGIPSLHGLQNIALSPNPAIDQLRLEVEASAATNLQITITNALGQVVQRATSVVYSGLQLLPLNIKNLPSGSYVVHLESVIGSRSLPFIKK